MADSDNESGGQNNAVASSREQDRLLPIANVGRIMKRALPANAKISKDAKETVQECVSEFISFVTGEASEKCQREKRKTVNGDDLLWAMSTLGFEEYIEPLRVYLQRFREMEGEKMGMPSGSQKDATGGDAGGFGAGGSSAGMYGGGGGMVMMGQSMYDSPKTASAYQHQMTQGGKGGLGDVAGGRVGGGQGGRGSSSASSPGLGWQGRV